MRVVGIDDTKVQGEEKIVVQYWLVRFLHFQTCPEQGGRKRTDVLGWVHREKSVSCFQIQPAAYCWSLGKCCA